MTYGFRIKDINAETPEYKPRTYKFISRKSVNVERYISRWIYKKKNLDINIRHNTLSGEILVTVQVL